MKIIDIARELDNLFFEESYTVKIAKSGEVSNIILNDTLGNEIEFCRVGESHVIKLNGDLHKITKSEFENIFSPYLGKRLFISL